MCVNTLPKRSFQLLSSRENQKNFMVALGKKLGYKNPSDWYQFSAKVLIENGGKSLLRRYDQRFTSVVMGVFNEETWHPWLFKFNPWATSATMCKHYMEYLFQRLNFKSMEDWYTICTDDFIVNNGSSLLAKYGRTPSGVVMGVLSHHQWQFWKFSHPPRYIWNEHKNVQQYIKYLGEQLGYKDMKDWYHITANDIITNHGDPLLRIHERSASTLVMRTMPDRPWLPFLFRRRNVTQNRHELVQYVTEMEQEIGLKSAEEWYGVQKEYMARLGPHFSSMDDFVTRLLRMKYPDHAWDSGKFTKFSKPWIQHSLKELLSRQFPSLEVIENYLHPLLFFPETGDVMSIDVFIPQLNLAFDYNGEPHYKQMKISKDVQEKQRLDSIKRHAFEQMGYTVVVVPYWWDGTIDTLMHCMTHKT